MSDQRSDDRDPMFPPADSEIAPVGPGEVETGHSAEVDDAAGGPTSTPQDEQIAAELGDFA